MPPSHSLPWCLWNAPVEINNFLIGCPLPRRKCLGAPALSKTKHAGRSQRDIRMVWPQTSLSYFHHGKFQILLIKTTGLVGYNIYWSNLYFTRQERNFLYSLKCTIDMAGKIFLFEQVVNFEKHKTTRLVWSWVYWPEAKITSLRPVWSSFEDTVYIIQ